MARSADNPDLRGYDPPRSAGPRTPGKGTRLIRKCLSALFVVLVAGVVAGTSGALAADISLVLPQGDAFAILGHSCGGIQETAYATGFDQSSGYPTGAVYLKTRCGGSGRGGGYHSTTYTAWAGAVWDFTGAVVSYQELASAPTVDPTFSAIDTHGNRVYNLSGHTYLSLAAGFAPAPRLSGISVSQGPAGGGTTVSITGTGFTGATAVDFGSTPAAGFTVNGDTSITAVSPTAPAGTVDVTVTGPGGTSAPLAGDQFTFVPVPSVTGIDPGSGPITGGTLVTITGTGLSAATTVDFGEQPAGFTINGDSSITATAPPGEAVDSVDVTVTSLGGTSATGSADQFSYVAVGPPAGNPGQPTVAAPRDIRRPSIIGAPARGRALRCRPGTWSGSPSFRYRWLRDGAIAGRGRRHVVVAADEGTTLSCLVIARNARGSRSVASDGVAGPPLVFSVRF